MGIRPSLLAYQAGILKECGSPTLVIGGVADHVHTLFCVSKKHALTDVIEELKKSSSKWLKTRGNGFRDFRWQAGYGAFSVSASSAEEVRHYIDQQEEHHRKRTFQEEFVALLKSYRMEFDEKYLWD